MVKNSQQNNHTSPSQVYKFEKIVDKRIRGGKLELKIRWEGWKPIYDSWEPAENIISGLSESQQKIMGKRERKPTSKSQLVDQPILTQSKNSQKINQSPKPQVYYQVEKVLSVRVNLEGFKQYKVRWQGYTSDHDSWVPSYNFKKQAQSKQSIYQKAPRKEKMLLKKIFNDSKKNFHQQQQSSHPQKIQSPKKQLQHLETDQISQIQLFKKRQSRYICKSKEVQVQQTLNLNSSCDFEAREKEGTKRISKNYYAVRDVISRKTETNKCKTKVKYRIRWEGYSPKDDTWEVRQNLTFMEEIVDEFDQRLPYPECEIVDDKMVKGKKIFKIHWKGFSQEEDTWQSLQNMIHGDKLEDVYMQKCKQIKDIGGLITMSSFRLSMNRENVNADKRQMISEMENDNMENEQAEDEQFEGFSEEEVHQVFPLIEDPEQEFEMELQNKFSTFNINLIQDVSFIEDQDQILKCIGN